MAHHRAEIEVEVVLQHAATHLSSSSSEEEDEDEEMVEANDEGRLLSCEAAKVEYECLRSRWRAMPSSRNLQLSAPPPSFPIAKRWRSTSALRRQWIPGTRSPPKRTTLSAVESDRETMFAELDSDDKPMSWTRRGAHNDEALTSACPRS